MARKQLGAAPSAATDAVTKSYVSSYVSVSNLADSTETGRALVTAANATEARNALQVEGSTIPIVYGNPATKADGAIAAGDALDRGTVFTNTGQKPIRYESGRFVHDPRASAGASSAGYIQLDTENNPVRVMKAEVAWKPSSIGAVAFVIPQTTGTWTHPSQLPAAGIHLTAYGNGLWEMAVWNPGSGGAAAGEVDHSVQPGTATSFTLTVQTTTPASTQTTASITAGASAAAVTAAIEALSNVAPGEVTVTKSTSGNYGLTWASGLGAVTLTATPTGGTMGMAAPLPTNPANTISGVVTYATGLTPYGAWTNVLRYATVWDDELRWFEVYVYPDTDECELAFPDGQSSGRLVHPGIGLWTGPRGVFELFENNSGQVDVPATFGTIAVSDEDFDLSLYPTAPETAQRIKNSETAYASQTLYAGGNTTGSDITASGTIPTGTTHLEVILIAGGSGGGSGGCQTSGTAVNGGGGGGSGGYIREIIPAASFPANNWGITVGRKGTGGASISSTGSGNAGTAGTASKFTLGVAGTTLTLHAYPGTGGGGGGSAGTFGTAGGVGFPYGTAGAASGVNGAVGAAGGLTLNYHTNPGSGGGGGVTTAPAATNGGAGGTNFPRGYTGGTAGVVGGAAPGRGTDGTGTAITSTPGGIVGPGAGGGAGSSSGAAQAGAAAAGWGGGGGGGGASLNGSASGAGGDGAGGYVLVIAHLR